MNRFQNVAGALALFLFIWASVPQAQVANLRITEVDPDGDAVETDFARLGLDDAWDQSTEGGLARSDASHNGEAAARRYGEGEVPQDDVIVVCERDVIEYDFASWRWGLCCLVRVEDFGLFV